MPSPLIDHLDRIVGDVPCGLSIEEIGAFTFGGFMLMPDPTRLIPDVMEVGIALRKHQGMPLATPVPPQLGFFLVAWAGERLMDERIVKGDMGIGKVRRRIEKIERRDGVEDGLVPWREGHAPPQWEAANEQFIRISDRIFVEVLGPHAADMADLVVRDVAEFERRRETGRKNFARLLGRDDLLRDSEELLAELLESEYPGSRS